MPSPLTSVLNFRDVGTTINDFTGLKILQTGKFFRAARPDEASPADRGRLLKEFRIKSIIDLRTETEHIEQAKKHNARLAAAAASSEVSPLPDQVVAESVQISGMKYHNINFNGKAYSNMLLSKLTWMQYLRLIRLMIFGYRIDAIRIIGENVMRDRGLIGLGVDSIDSCTAEVKQFFNVLADATNYPLIVHCTQGKDRTGLTVLLTLLLSDVPIDAAQHDYMISQDQLIPERKERVKEINSIGLPDSFADCDPDFVKQVDKHIKEAYGGIKQYLQHAGVDIETQEKVRKNIAAAH